MRALQHLRVGDYQVMPWKNGLGTTTEVVVDPVGADLDSFAWRVSIADLTTSGDFSRFDGCDRLIAQLEGAPMTLVHEGRGAFCLNPLTPHRFAGEETTRAELASAPARDFNVIVRRDRAHAELVAHRLMRGASLHTTAENLATVVYLARGVVVVEGDAARHTLAAGETCVARGGVALVMTAGDDDATALVATITAR